MSLEPKIWLFENDDWDARSCCCCGERIPLGHLFYRAEVSQPGFEFVRTDEMHTNCELYKSKEIGNEPTTET